MATPNTPPRNRPTEKFLSKLIREYRQNTTPDALLAASYQKNHNLMTEEARAQLIDEIKQKRTAELHAEITRVQTNAAATYAELRTAQERAKVRAVNGEFIVSQYAEQHGIDREQAKQELKDYASRKASQFDPNSLADQYAALANRLAGLQPHDRSLAEDVAKAQLDHVTTEPRETTDFYERFTKQYPQRVVDWYESSGVQLLISSWGSDTDAQPEGS